MPALGDDTPHESMSSEERLYLMTKREDSTALKLVEEQTNDHMLWLIALTAHEVYLQAALRALHSAVEQDWQSDSGEEVGP